MKIQKAITLFLLFTLVPVAHSQTTTRYYYKGDYFNSLQAAEEKLRNSAPAAEGTELWEYYNTFYWQHMKLKETKEYKDKILYIYRPMEQAPHVLEEGYYWWKNGIDCDAYMGRFTHNKGGPISDGTSDNDKNYCSDGEFLNKLLDLNPYPCDSRIKSKSLYDEKGIVPAVHILHVLDVAAPYYIEPFTHPRGTRHEQTWEIHWEYETTERDSQGNLRCSGDYTERWGRFQRRKDYLCQHDLSGTAGTIICGVNSTLSDSIRLNLAKGNCKEGIGGQNTVGNPCSPGTGEKTQSEIDFQGNDINFTRTYRSYNDAPSDNRIAPGWQHNYSMRLRIRNGSPIGMTTSSGGYQTQFLADSVEQNNEGWLMTSTRQDFQFNIDGRLDQIFHRGGRVTQLIYTDDGNESTLDRIVSSYGHEIQLQYNSAGQLISMTDPSGLVYTYSYTNSNLSSVKYPGGRTKHYLYESDTAPHLLTGITDENGDRFATFAYDDQGRAILTEHAQTDNGAPQEQFQLDYGQ